MQTLIDFLNFPHQIEITEDYAEGGFVASFPELPGCITVGETVEAAIANAKDAKEAWFYAVTEEQCRAIGGTP